MAFEKAEKYLASRGYADRVRTFNVSSATVELAAKALDTDPARIAKSLTFLVGEKAAMIVCAGDVKVNSGKFKQYFGVKAKMLTWDQVHEMIGHDVGGVCPFGVNQNVDVYMDVSILRFDVVYPACGSDNSAVCLTPNELFLLSNSIAWIDVCKDCQGNILDK